MKYEYIEYKYGTAFQIHFLLFCIQRWPGSHRLSVTLKKIVLSCLFIIKYLPHYKSLHFSDQVLWQTHHSARRPIFDNCKLCVVGVTVDWYTQYLTLTDAFQCRAQYRIS